MRDFLLVEVTPESEFDGRMFMVEGFRASVHLSGHVVHLADQIWAVNVEA